MELKLNIAKQGLATTAEVINEEFTLNYGHIFRGKGTDKVKEVTYAELRDLKKEGKLEAGMMYRIIDFVTSTTQGSTKSAEHPFDIIVTALDNSTLSEIAKAIHHKGDTYFANNNLAAWQVWYDFNNNTSRFSWAKKQVDEAPQRWTSQWGVLEEKFNNDASNNYTTAVVDGKTKYLYRPIEPTNYLEGKEFFERVKSGSITSPDNLVFVGDDVPVNEGNDDDPMWWWGDMGDIRVYTADGTQIATLHCDGDSFIDERDEGYSYGIYFDPNAVEDENGNYIFTPIRGLGEWWEDIQGGRADIYVDVPYEGSTDSLYYAFDSALSKSSKSVAEVYSADTGKIYRYSRGNIDTVSYKAYTAYVEGGKGVIYKLTDEFGNTCNYDFKNIQFKQGTDWYYTFGETDNSISGVSLDNTIDFTNEKKIVPTIFKNEAKWNRFYAVVTTSATFEGKVQAVSIDTTSSGFTTILTKGDLFGGVIDGNTKGSLTTDKMTAFRIQSGNNSTFTGTFLYCSFFGAGSVSIVDANGNQKSLRGLRAYFGATASSVKLVYNGTMSTTEGIKNIELVAPDWGSSAVTVNLDGYKEGVKIAKNSSGVVKVWNEADLA